MIVIASANGAVGIEEAMRVLKDGGSALDAVEAGIRPVERNLEQASSRGGEAALRKRLEGRCEWSGALTAIPATSGFEQGVARGLAEEMRPVADRVGGRAGNVYGIAEEAGERPGGDDRLAHRGQWVPPGPDPALDPPLADGFPGSFAL
jgi:hypothetical protein